MPQKIYLTILKSGIYLSFVSVFLVFKNLLFPFITSKQISFNILIEILFVLWFAFIIKYPEYRPKKSWISFGLIGFFTAMILSCFTTVDFNLSFWGDIERMLGIFHLLHFLAFYFIIITVMRTWRDWKILFIISVICAVFVSFYGLANKHYSTIGNTAYVSGYLIFNMYFCLILFFKEKSKGLRWLYILPIPIMLLEFEKASTTGAHVGLGFSVIVLLLLYALLSKNKRIKAYLSAAFLIAVLILTFAFINKESNWVKSNSILRMVGEVNVQKNTFQTRLISWKAALKDFPNHPVLGTGHGNYAITFDKYFEPTFYDHTRSETYFDRAHNNIVDIASTTGGLGLVAYLLIFIAAIYYLISGYRKEKISMNEFILLVSLMIAYFIQNLAVFDSLVTYMALMAMLGYIYWLSNQEAKLPIGSLASSEFINKEIYALAGAGLIILIIMFQYNIKPLKMLTGTIQGQIAFAQKDFEGGIEIYKKALSYNTILDRDSRDSLIRAIASNYSAIAGMDKQKAKEILDYAVELAEENVKYNPRDSLMQMQLAQILNITARFHGGNAQRFSFYSDRALEAIDKSIESSPGRIPIYFVKAQIQATRNEQEQAIETLQYATSLNEKYYDSYCNLAKYYFIFKQEENGHKTMDQCIDKGGSGLLAPADYVKSLINHYAESQDWDKSLKLYKRLSELEKDNAKVWVNLAKLYAQTGDIESAKKAAEKAAELDHSMINAVEEFIRGLE